MSELTHFDAKGNAWMVDITEKEETHRVAEVRGEVVMAPATLELIQQGGMAKGDVLGVARVAGIMAAKSTPNLIPMAHPIMITGVNIDFQILPPDRVEIRGLVKTGGKTGVEMEALTAVSVAALTIYDMCKAVDKGMMIQNIRLVSKSGGKSGDFMREGESQWEK
ncbi:GTP cyclohydrolase subunit MoaC [Desulforamulus reducens MI-1]|uniref:Cyclic pyranopterin monophosphate synthase n=1 Tax=Desulforamulus reducens (strain ATCC BAA-1160 / DSM 100696 / MI-1) TaxID=349161 RepID=MOAC_DESRM|nr:cyclic pyranopterin monophosphate synthase MoaC [Desulforamulus reducens]A4J6S4.1 RecName: Full=Cyclic pyranopterin monophosphate synthase; AltName: Full=Molybdenum cofactor biosynthesis protein C [Desulforamulus reducens MI-1]ABO50777.1 GTP cyclohydrolase subunit MoaC [Desulforamulus reducens MI-1]